MRPLESLRLQLSLLDILQNVDNIEEIIEGIEANAPHLLQEAVNMVKDAVQEEARQAWRIGGFWGMLLMATGTGKSKIPINVLLKVAEAGVLPRVLLIVPTKKLRDSNWKKEFEKWGAGEIYPHIQRTCYASLHKIKGQEFDLVIGDEFHNSTDANAVFYKNNTIHKLIALTATDPRNTNEDKRKLFKKLKVVYNLPLDIAVRLRLVASYEITIVDCLLDNTEVNTEVFVKKQRYLVTEKEGYTIRDDVTESAIRRGGWDKQNQIMSRMRFIKNLPSKVKNAKFILQNFIPAHHRKLIFCGGIEQAIELSPYRYFSKPSAKKDDPPEKKERVRRILAEYAGDKWIDAFIDEEIDEISCVSALNEGHNLPNVDTMLVIAIESGELTITQQIGRAIRYRLGHIGKVIILRYKETKEADWVANALSGFDQNKIRYVSMEDILNGTVNVL